MECCTFLLKRLFKDLFRKLVLTPQSLIPEGVRALFFYIKVDKKTSKVGKKTSKVDKKTNKSGLLAAVTKTGPNSVIIVLHSREA